MITLQQVSVEVPVYAAGQPRTTRTLLSDLTLRLEQRRIAVIGANGSGKSTFLRLLNGLVAPTRGSVNVDGLDTIKDGRTVRRQVGFMFTDPLSQLVMPTALEDVELSLRGRIQDRAARREAGLGLLARRGLDAVAGQSIYDLSGGERQLVALTSVLAVEPAVLVADEPTTLLDLRNRDRVRRELAQLDQQVIFATHDLDLATDADRVLVFERGRVVADGDPRQCIHHYVELIST